MDAWWIKDLERLRREQNGQQEDQRPSIQLPLPSYTPQRQREGGDEGEQRGVIIIDIL